MAVSATTKLDSDRSNEDNRDDATELPSFASIMEDTVSKGFPLSFFNRCRLLAAALSAIMIPLLKHGFIVCHLLALAAATVKCAREKDITFTTR